MNEGLHILNSETGYYFQRDCLACLGFTKYRTYNKTGHKAMIQWLGVLLIYLMNHSYCVHGETTGKQQAIVHILARKNEGNEHITHNKQEQNRTDAQTSAMNSAYSLVIYRYIGMGVITTETRGSHLQVE